MTGFEEYKRFKKSLKKIINHFYADEKRHYEECADKKKHIFNDIEVVRKWMQEVRGKTKKPKKGCVVK